MRSRPNGSNLFLSEVATEWEQPYYWQYNCQPKSGKDKPHEDMSRKKREPEKTAEVKQLEARIRELELQNLALNTLIDVAERNGVEIRKKSGAKQ